jgi:hypothetical protein
VKCDDCKEPVALTFRKGSALGVRCAQCLTVFCLDCGWRHFGMKHPRWATRSGRFRVPATKRKVFERKRKVATNLLRFYPLPRGFMRLKKKRKGTGR